MRRRQEQLGRACSRGGHALVGAAIGAVIGGVLGAAWPLNARGLHPLDISMSSTGAAARLKNALANAALFGAVGAGIGAIPKSTCPI